MLEAMLILRSSEYQQVSTSDHTGRWLQFKLMTTIYSIKKPLSRKKSLKSMLKKASRSSWKRSNNTPPTLSDYCSRNARFGYPFALIQTILQPIFLFSCPSDRIHLIIWI